MNPQEIKTMIARCRENGQSFLGNQEVKTILGYYGIPIVREGMASSADEAVRLSNSIGYPVALKIVSPDISHKTEAQGVSLNLRSSREVEEACSDLLAKAKGYKSGVRVEGYLIQEMVEDGIETIIGMNTDPTFGPVLMFGLGGVWVELLKDVCFRVVPIGMMDAIDMIEEIKGSRLLKGFRGRPSVDTEALCEILLSVSKLVVELKEVKEMDLNPVFVKPKGAVVADARIIIRE
jgi:acyl-CoA synthetase (NDP forming)